jgi:hypothetical protein
VLDLDRDPGELSPLSPTPTGLTRSWTSRTVTSYETMKQQCGGRSWLGLDHVNSDALRALGYVE